MLPREGALQKKLIPLAIWIVVCVGGGALTGIATAGGDSEWYRNLQKPAWTPPSWVFAPVWTTLYAAMGISAWLVWRRGGWRAQRTPLSAFVVQLAFNFSWSFFFFGMQRIALALADIVLLWIAIVATLTLFARVDRLAAWLLAPYLAWVTYAAALNAAIFAAN